MKKKAKQSEEEWSRKGLCFSCNMHIIYPGECKWGSTGEGEREMDTTWTCYRATHPTVSLT